MPILVRELGLYVLLLVLMSLVGVPGALAALVGGVAFAAVVWREVQR